MHLLCRPAAVIILSLIFPHIAAAQTSSTLGLVPVDVTQALVPQGSSGTVNVTVDGGSNGSDTLDVAVTDLSVVVSVTTPSGVSVTSQNAASLGIQWTTLTVPNSSDPVSSILTIPGYHTIIQLPPGSPTGQYQIKGDGTSAAGPAAMLVSYSSSSSVVAGLSASPDSPSIGNPITLSAVLLDGANPIVGATGTVQLIPSVDVTSQVSVTSVLLSTTVVDSLNSSDIYAINLQNSGPGLTSLLATLNAASLPPTVQVSSNAVYVNQAPAQTTTQSPTGFTVTRPTSTPFDPTTLQWKVTASGTPTQVSLTDGGPGDAQAGDGIYTGSFTPTIPGDYIALLKAQGTGNSALAFLEPPLLLLP